jgi:transcriptional regulator with XRE-family HTH domain
MEAVLGHKVIEHFATEETPFHFTDSGLDNVYLVGIKYFTREDGSVIAEIPAIKQLMRLIACDLLYSSAPLKGQEIRFLRKRLGKKAVDFSKLLRLEAETLSRIENEKQDASDQVDALVRVCYLLSCDDPELQQDANRLMAFLKKEIDRHREKRIVMKVSADNEWTDLPVAA